MLLSLVVLSATLGHVGSKYPGEEKHDMGSLEGDVQNWAMLIQNYILQVKLNKKISVFRVTGLKILGTKGRHTHFF